MAKYLHWYNDKEDFEEDYWGGNYVEPWFSITVDAGERQLDFDREDYKELFKTPLTFEFNEGGEFYFYYDAITDEYTKTVTYSLNGGPKVRVTPTSENTIIVQVEQGDVMQVWAITQLIHTVSIPVKILTFSLGLIANLVLKET